MTFDRDERLMQLELDRAILYGESCMLEYDIQVAKLQEEGILTESSIDSLQYLLEAAVSESGFGGVLNKIREFFSNFLKKFKDKNEQQRFNNGVDKIKTMLDAGAINIDQTIELCASPEAIEEIAKRFQATVDRIAPKIANGTASQTEVDELKEAKSVLEQLKEKAGVELGENQDETKKVLTEIVDRGYDGIIGRTDKISTNIDEIIQRANAGFKATMEKYGVDTTKEVVGGVATKKGKGKDATITTQTSKVTVNKSGEEIGKEVAAKATGKNDVIDSKAQQDKIDAQQKKVDELKKAYDDLSKGGTVKGDAVDSAYNAWQSAEGELKKLKKDLNNSGKTSFDKAHEEVDQQAAKKGAYATDANIQAFKEAHHLLLQYVELYAMLEGKYAIECDKAISKLGGDEKKKALESYKNENLATIDARINAKVKELHDLDTNSDPDADRKGKELAKEIQSLREHKKAVENALGDSRNKTTEDKMAEMKSNITKAKTNADKATGNLQKSNNDQLTSTDVKNAVKNSAVGELAGQAKNNLKGIVNKFFPKKSSEKKEEEDRKKRIDKLHKKQPNTPMSEIERLVDEQIKRERREAREKSNG